MPRATGSAIAKLQSRTDWIPARSSMVVVDFKTDRELDEALERYQKQVSIYATAVGRTAGLSTRAYLMRL